MPRPQKAKQVCRLPGCFRFCPDRTDGQKAGHQITLLVEEYETIRLMDYLGMSQEECAAQMGVARATVQSMYADARRKLARFLVEGADLDIGGGSYQLYGEAGCGSCRRAGCQTGFGPKPERAEKENLLASMKYERGEVISMKLAVTYENGQVFQHFGHTEQFKVYEVEDGAIKAEQVVDTDGFGHGALAGFLQQLGVSVLICGGIGGGARNALAEAGIQLYPGASGDTDQQVKAFLAGSLAYNPDTVCSHHSHEEGHSCHGHEEGHSCHGHGPEGHSCH